MSESKLSKITGLIALVLFIVTSFIIIATGVVWGLWAVEPYQYAVGDSTKEWYSMSGANSQNTNSMAVNAAFPNASVVQNMLNYTTISNGVVIDSVGRVYSFSNAFLFCYNPSNTRPTWKRIFTGTTTPFSIMMSIDTESIFYQTYGEIKTLSTRSGTSFNFRSRVGGCSSPIAEAKDGTVYAVCDYKLTAFTSGLEDIAWVVNTNATLYFDPNTIVLSPDDKYLFMTSAQTMFVVNTEAQEIVYTYQMATGSWMTYFTSVAAANTSFVVTQYSKYYPVETIIIVYAYDTWEELYRLSFPTVTYTNAYEAADVSISPLNSNNTSSQILVVSNLNDQLAAYDLQTGGNLWTYKLPASSTTLSKPTITNDVIYFSTFTEFYFIDLMTGAADSISYNITKGESYFLSNMYFRQPIAVDYRGVPYVLVPDYDHYNYILYSFTNNEIEANQVSNGRNVGWLQVVSMTFIILVFWWNVFAAVGCFLCQSTKCGKFQAIFLANNELMELLLNMVFTKPISYKVCFCGKERVFVDRIYVGILYIIKAMVSLMISALLQKVLGACLICTGRGEWVVILNSILTTILSAPFNYFITVYLYVCMSQNLYFRKANFTSLIQLGSVMMVNTIGIIFVILEITFCALIFYLLRDVVGVIILSWTISLVINWITTPLFKAFCEYEQLEWAEENDVSACRIITGTPEYNHIVITKKNVSMYKNIISCLSPDIACKYEYSFLPPSFHRICWTLISGLILIGLIPYGFLFFFAYVS